jgi:hypothetical protein
LLDVYGVKNLLLKIIENNEETGQIFLGAMREKQTPINLWQPDLAPKPFQIIKNNTKKD